MVFDNGSQIPYIVRSTTHYKGRQLKKLLNEFKAFIMTGNVLMLAVAFILGGATKAVIDGFVTFIINPVIAAIVGKPTFDDLVLGIGDAKIKYGSFITTLVNLVIVGAVLFMMVKAFETFKKKADETPEPPAEEVVLLREIRDALAARS